MATDDAGTVNMWETYHKVYYRTRRSKGPALAVAMKAEALAGVVLRARFRQVEDHWLAMSPRGKSMADDFEKAIRTGKYVDGRPAHSVQELGWNPRAGTVYVATCARLPGLVKIGAVSGGPEQLGGRLKAYVRRYRGKFELDVLQSTFSIKVDGPGFIESAAQRKLRSRRVALTWTKSNEWFRATPADARAAIQESIRRARQERTAEPRGS